MIKAITFDLDGVYFTPQSFPHFKSALSPTSSADELSQVLNKSEQMLQFKSGKLSEDQFWQYAIKTLNLTLSQPEIYQLLANSYEVNPEVRDYVRQVRRAGYKTCICSNNFITRTRELNQKFAFLKDFDVQVFSYELGFTKPDPRIFQALIDTSGVQPFEIVYSDDNPVNLSGAISLGINCFVFESFRQFKSQLESLEVQA